jgi:sterol O-acyltransferase
MASTSRANDPLHRAPSTEARARNPWRIELGAALQGGSLKPGRHPSSESMASGYSTPIPSDAPPSVQATSSARKQIRAERKIRSFPTIAYEARVSHFDPKSDYRDFRGFFVLFWVGLAIMVITTMLKNFKENGSPLRMRQWDLFTENIWELAASDFLMYVRPFSLPLLFRFPS